MELIARSPCLPRSLSHTFPASLLFHVLTPFDTRQSLLSNTDIIDISPSRTFAAKLTQMLCLAIFTIIYFIFEIITILFQVKILSTWDCSRSKQFYLGFCFY